MRLALTPFDAIKMQMGAAVPFATHVGLKIEELERGRGVTSLDLAPDVKNHLGTMHAAALFAVGEAASGAAMAGTFADVIMSVRPVAAEAHINYLRPTKSGVRAEATIVGCAQALRDDFDAKGKTAFSIAVSVNDESGTEVASMTVDWHVKRVG